MFVGRKSELKILDEAYRSGKSELVVIYGRRRIGKSSLVNVFSKNKRHFYSFEAIEGASTQVQIRHFFLSNIIQSQDLSPPVYLIIFLVNNLLYHLIEILDQVGIKNI